MNKDCTFCKIITGANSARVVYRDKHTIAFLPLELNVIGHTLVAPITHSSDIFDIPETDVVGLMRTTQIIASHLKKQIGAEGINILHASGSAAQQSVPHFHIHLLPRFNDDNIDAWPSLPIWNGDPDELQRILRMENNYT